MLRVTILFATLFILPFQIVTAQTTQSKATVKPVPSPTAVSPAQAKADAAWQKVGTPSDAPEPVNGARTYIEAVKKWGDGTRTGYLDSPDYWRWTALRRLQFRDEGLKFWREFPNDQRRYRWLLQTIWPGQDPFYWKDTEQAIRSKQPANEPFDESALKAWNDTYSVLRAEFMASHQVTDKMRARLQFEELERDMFDLKRLSVTPTIRSYLMKQFIARYLDLERDPDVLDSDIYYAASVLFEGIGDDTGAESAFIEDLKLSKRTEIQLLGYGREQIAKLRANPFELKATTLKGEPIDVAKLRGKIVLVDIWSNWCTGCIAAMPRVKAVYDKYRDKGFEVVGVWLSTNEANEKPKALDILNEKGVNWPNCVMAGKAHDEFTKRYSIYYVPVTFLLDRNGKLVTNDVSGNRLEQEVKRLL